MVWRVTAHVGTCATTIPAQRSRMDRGEIRLKLRSVCIHVAYSQRTYGAGTPKWVLLLVRHLQQWIEQHLMFIVNDAPSVLTTPGFSSRRKLLPKRTGHNQLLIAGMSEKADVRAVLAGSRNSIRTPLAVISKPNLVQIGDGFTREPCHRILARHRGLKPEKRMKIATKLFSVYGCWGRGEWCRQPGRRVLPSLLSEPEGQEMKVGIRSTRSRGQGTESSKTHLPQA